MVTQARRFSWQLLLVIALAVALVATITITYWATHSYATPHHMLAGWCYGPTLEHCP